MPICLKGLPPRTITTPYYANDKDTQLQYFEQLSKMLHNDAVREGNNMSVRNYFVVQTLTTNENNREDKPMASKTNTSDIKLDVKQDVNSDVESGVKADGSIKNESLNNSVKGIGNL